MALVLDGVDQSAYLGAGLTSPCSLSCWFKTTDMAHNGFLVCANGGATAFFGSRFRGDLASDVCGVQTYNGSWSTAETTNGCTTDTWHHCLVVYHSSTSKKIYLDGGTVAEDTTSNAPSLTNDITVGTHKITGGDFFNGKIAYVTAWDIALTSSDATTLAGGEDPTNVETSDIVGSWNLVSDYVADIGSDLTGSNSPTFDVDEPDIGTIHEITGTGAGTGAGSARLDSNYEITGSGDGSGDGSAIAGFNIPILGIDVAQGSGSGFLFLTKDLSMTGGASSAGSASGSIWVSKDFVLNDTDYRIKLTFDPDKQGILVTRTNTQTFANDNIWYDLRTKGFYPETYQQDCCAYDAIYYPHAHRQYAGLLVAADDGYLRVFDDKSLNDTGSNIDEAISSYTLTSPFMLNEEEMEGKFKSIQLYLGGKSLGTGAAQSDALSYEIYVGNSIEEVYANIKNGETPADSGTVTGSGRSSRQMVYGRGAYGVIKLYNSSVSSTWALNKLSAVIQPAGRIR